MGLRLFKVTLSIACLSLTSMMFSQSALSQDSEVEGIVNISELTCRELLLMHSDNRQATMVFVQGYLSGKTSEVDIDTEKLRTASDLSLQQCVDEPDTPILGIFEQNR